MKKLIFLISLFFSFNSYCIDNDPIESVQNNFVGLSIPKCGTHLLLKTLYYLTNLTAYNLSNNEINYELIVSNPSCFFVTHTHNSANKFNNIINQQSLKTILIIRDLRDAIVSFSNWIDKDMNNPMKIRENFSKLSHEKKIIYSINEIEPFLKDINLWLNNPYVLVIRFEDLVGEKGGGSLQAQRNTIIKIAEHLNISLSEEQLFKIENSLFGNKIDNTYTQTFYSGQIGSWKQNFNKEHIDIFKRKLNNYLILLGYENDDKW